MSDSLSLSRRQFLARAPFAIAAGALSPTVVASPTPTGPPDFCVFLADHWSYTGIGW